jgi:hypothetical protein
MCRTGAGHRGGPKRGPERRGQGADDVLFVDAASTVLLEDPYVSVVLLEYNSLTCPCPCTQRSGPFSTDPDPDPDPEATT